MKKIIFVATVYGRCGSSMTMGLLARCGVSVGKDADKLKSVEVPVGSYELQVVEKHWQKYYQKQNWENHTKNLTNPRLSYDKHLALKSVRSELDAIIESVCEGKYPVAIKAMDFAGIAAYENDPDYDIRVICLHRNIEDQARSISKMWGNVPQYPPQAFHKWLKDGYAWVEGFKKEFKFPYLDVNFNDMLDDPEGEGLRICEFCEISKPTSGMLSNYVNKEYSKSRIPRVVEGFLHDPEVELLSRLARNLEKGVIVELGSYLGKSAYAMAFWANKNVKIYCVDHWNNVDMPNKKAADTFEAFKNNLGEYFKKIIPIRSDTSTAAKTFNDEIDILFIDANHSYEGCMKDIVAWYPKVKNGGVILFHDYTEKTCGVSRVVDEFFANKHRGIVVCSIYKVIK